MSELKHRAMHLTRDDGMVVMNFSDDNREITPTAESALFVAALESARQGRAADARSRPGLATDPARHADAVIIRGWLSRIKREPSEFDVICYLAVFVRNEWATMPRRTAKEHRALFRRIRVLCRELLKALWETGADYIPSGGLGLRSLRMLDLITDAERAEFEADLVPVDSGEVGDDFRLAPGACLPTVAELLQRVAAAAQRLEEQGPLHAQPTKRGAERGYFVRRMGALLQQRYGEQPHEVIAALTTIALGEATDRELVTKLLT